MSIRDLMMQFEIQGGYCIKAWSNKYNDCIVLKEGTDFECERHKIKGKYLDA